MRLIILDTETTGLSPHYGHRIIEIGCIEMQDMRHTGQYFHAYINPERDVPQKSTEITGLTYEFLKNHPPFGHIVDDFLTFIGDSPLVIHNAAFDMKFLNAELALAQKALIAEERAVDTLMMARRKFPGSPASLDALCKRFKIDLTERDKHGALLDAQLLSHVYIELMGGRQKSLTLGETENDAPDDLVLGAPVDVVPADVCIHVPQTISEEELQNHKNFVDTLKNPLWYRAS